MSNKPEIWQHHWSGVFRTPFLALFNKYLGLFYCFAVFMILVIHMHEGRLCHEWSSWYANHFVSLWYTSFPPLGNRKSRFLSLLVPKLENTCIALFTHNGNHYVLNDGLEMLNNKQANNKLNFVIVVFGSLYVGHQSVMRFVHDLYC